MEPGLENWFAVLGRRSCRQLAGQSIGLPRAIDGQGILLSPEAAFVCGPEEAHHSGGVGVVYRIHRHLKLSCQ